MMKVKQTVSKLGRMADQGKTFLRGYATKSFNTLDNIRERADPILTQADSLLKSQNVERVRKILATASEMDPRISKLGLTSKYDMAISTARRGVDIGQDSLDKLNRFMESEELKKVRKMTGTGRGRVQALPRLPQLRYNSHGLSYFNSVKPFLTLN